MTARTRLDVTLVERGLCLRHPTSMGNLLVFPSKLSEGAVGHRAAFGGAGELSLHWFPFTLKKQPHAECWMASAFPVLLVIRNSEGEVRCCAPS